MITYTGIHVTPEFGAPSLRDIAVQTMRIPRFCGAGEIFWPVGMHLLLVADLCPPELEHHALLHDAAEACVSDVPRPMKTAQAKTVEARIIARLYTLLGVNPPTKKEQKAIHAADMRALGAEGCSFPGPRGFAQTQPDIDHSDTEALELLRRYLDAFTPEQSVVPNGYWPRLLENRLRFAVERARASAQYLQPA